MLPSSSKSRPTSPPRTGFARLLPRAHPISWWMLLITTGAMLITSIDRALLPAVLPGILDEFGLDATQGGLLISLSFVGSALGGLLLGIFSDALGRGPRRALAWLIMIMIVVVSSIASALTRSFAWFKVLRVTMGVGTGALEPINVAMIGEWWPEEQRGFAVGTHHTGLPIGQFIGPILIGVVISIASWQASFLLLPLLALPIVILQLTLARRRNLARVNQWVEANGMTPSLAVNKLDDTRLSNPLPDLIRTARKDRNVFLGVLINFLFLWTESAVVGFLTLQLTRGLGIPLAEAATISGASGITGWIGQIVWGSLSDRIGRKLSLQILALGSAATIALMIFIDSPAMAWLILIGWGLFRNSPYPVLYAAMIDTLPQSAASGLGLMVGIGLGISGVIATPIAGWLIDHYGFTTHYLSLAALCLLTMVPIAMMRESSPALEE